MVEEKEEVKEDKEKNAVPKQEEKKEEEIKEPNFLDQLKQKKEELDKSLAEMNKMLSEFKDLKAQEIISGKTEAGSQPEKPEEKSDKEYALEALRGLHGE